jgi:hypothetical protein
MIETSRLGGVVSDRRVLRAAATNALSAGRKTVGGYMRLCKEMQRDHGAEIP